MCIRDSDDDDDVDYEMQIPLPVSTTNSRPREAMDKLENKLHRRTVNWATIFAFADADIEFGKVDVASCLKQRLRNIVLKRCFIEPVVEEIDLDEGSMV